MLHFIICTGRENDVRCESVKDKLKKNKIKNKKKKMKSRLLCNKVEKKLALIQLSSNLTTPTLAGLITLSFKV